MEVQLTDLPFLFIEGMMMLCAGEHIDFDSDENTEISVDDFLELETLEDKIENSRGEWVATALNAYKDDEVLESEVREAKRFDNEEQALAAHWHIKKVLNAHQVANALGIDYEIVNGLNGEGSKIDRFEQEMKRRGF